MEYEQKLREIDNVLDKIRPFLQRDGGNVELIGYEDGVVYITLTGACDGCMFAQADIQGGISIILQEEVEGVTSVDASGMYPSSVMNDYMRRKEEQLLIEKEKQRAEELEKKQAQEAHLKNSK